MPSMTTQTMPNTTQLKTEFLASWNSETGQWETAQMDLFSELSEPFSGTWPTQGMTRNGVAYALPTWAPPMADSAFSGLESGETSSTLFKTPTSQLAINGGSQHPDKRKAGGNGPTLADEIEHLLPNVSVLFPTPTTQDGANDGGPSQFERNTPPLNTMVKMLPTPAANDSGNTPEDHLRKKPGRTQITSLQVIADYGLFASGGKLVDPDDAPPMSEWGDYEPAIRRWEAIFGHMSPPATEPRGKDGASRLSPRFVEWMMGQQPGHVTDVDITSNAQLKALGNGVVPQQAVAAIHHLFERFVAAYGRTA
ncbi:DNA methyltransferase [Arthrobacter phage vB_ArtM-ArV1]|uniref:DNA methyltransferase n=1 Tax=Arthrobacter phage vB_ArtM-ArV1 TaxID=1566993 RepID=A0A1B1FBJ0_9CAUD|nr:DNA methyltransferase [Arthrobacter phage vB_ArtM-ArV1]ANQ38583.1 DNA methyltransferase [Arthrobacter phage vB_ArtM-ArV1]